MTFREAVALEYQALLLMLDVAYPCILSCGLEARTRGDRRTEAVAQVALTALLEATLDGMNTLVDSAVASCEQVTNPSTPKVAETRLHRANRLSILEGRFSFDCELLPGWNAVKLTGDQASAVKHRLGLRWRQGSSTPLSIEGSVDLNEKELLLRLDDIHLWIVGLGRAAGLIPPVT